MMRICGHQFLRLRTTVGGHFLPDRHGIPLAQRALASSNWHRRSSALRLASSSAAAAASARPTAASAASFAASRASAADCSSSAARRSCEQRRSQSWADATLPDVYNTRTELCDTDVTVAKHETGHIHARPGAHYVAGKLTSPSCRCCGCPDERTCTCSVNSSTALSASSRRFAAASSSPCRASPRSRASPSCFRSSCSTRSQTACAA